MDKRFKKLMQELSDAINGSLSESPQIADVVSRIKAEGYDIFLVLEATIGFNRREEEAETASEREFGMLHSSSDPEFEVTAQDLKFLKSLRIAVDEAA